MQLSFSQERLWFLDRFEPGHSRYNIASAFKLTGKVDVDILESGFRKIVERHKILLSRFDDHDGHPFVSYHSSSEFKIDYIELKLESCDDSDEYIQKEISKHINSPLILDKDILIRIRLFKTADNEHILLLILHHIIADGWSMGIIFRELSELYNSAVNGKDSELGELSGDYSDYVTAERYDDGGENYRINLDYWRETLKANPDQLDLHCDNVRPKVKTYAGNRYSFSVNDAVFYKLKKLSKCQGVTLFTVLLSAFQVLLYRYTSHDRIPVGIPVANRDRPQYEDMIGLFLNTLIISPDLNGNRSFKDLLRSVRSQMRNAFKHRSIPFERLVEELQPDRDTGRNPLFQVMFALQNMPQVPLTLEQIDIKRFPVKRQSVKFDLTLDLMTSDDKLNGHFEYSRDLFREDTIERMVVHFCNLLKSIAEAPERRICDLKIMDKGEEKTILRDWNDNVNEYNNGRLLHFLFEEQVSKKPAFPAITFEGQTLTYAELNDKANKLANLLIKKGVLPDTIVGICMERSIDLIVSILGILKSGGAFLPIDPEYPVDRIRYILSDSDVKLVITKEDNQLDIESAELEQLYLKTTSELSKAEDVQKPKVSLTPENAAYMIYTSGTTGNPKGVINTHGGIYNRLRWQSDNYPMSTSDNTMLKHSISFDVSITEIFLPLTNGAHLHIAKPGGQKDPVYLANFIEEHQLTTIHFIPTMLRYMLDQPKFVNNKSLRLVFLGGEALPTELLERLSSALNAKIVNWYGPTEASVGVMYHVCTGKEENNIVRIGRPIGNVTIYILDKHQQPVPVGIPGELYIGGVAVARGYHNRPDLTSERFIKDPFTKDRSKRLYKTGDLVKYSKDGNVQYLGRIDDQVKIRGYRIELDEIETHLREIDGIRQAVVIAETDKNSVNRLIAYLVSPNGAKIDVGTVRSHLQLKLPEYMIPQIIKFVDEIPRLDNGKINRKALPDPEAVGLKSTDDYVAPRNQLDLKLQRIWTDILNIRPIGIHDNFFELGGHSLLAVQLFSEMKKASGKEIPLATLFTIPTIAGLSDILHREGWTPPPDKYFIVNEDGTKPTLFMLPPAGAAGLHFIELGQHLGENQPIIVLLPSGLENEEAPHSEIMEIAEICVKQIREIQPAGPYHVGGS